MAEHETSRETTHNPSRRAFVKRAMYVAPVILTLQAAPAFAKAGSQKQVGGTTQTPPRGSGSFFQTLLNWFASLFR